MPIIAHCPRCGGTDIREKNVAYAEIRVTAWEVVGDCLMPREWDWDVDAEWETDGIASFTYACHGDKADGQRCRWEGDIGDLAVEHEPDDEEP